MGVIQNKIANTATNDIAKKEKQSVATLMNSFLDSEKI